MESPDPESSSSLRESLVYVERARAGCEHSATAKFLKLIAEKMRARIANPEASAASATPSNSSSPSSTGASA